MDAPCATQPAGKLVGQGRTADVYEHGVDQVLRRYRAPRDTEREVAAMQHARTQGFPVPWARALNETDILMERIPGRTMIADLLRRPWLLPRHARTLAALHHRLHAIEAPESLPRPLGDGMALIHLDLHPDNVILSPQGPVVVDWPNASRGPPDADVAFSWVVLACSLPPRGGVARSASRAGRHLFLELFLRGFDRHEVRRHLAAACAYRLEKRDLPAGELHCVRRLLERTRRR